MSGIDRNNDSDDVHFCSENTPSSSSSSPPQQALATLPKNIETATVRYLINYQKQFSGPAEEMTRLKSLAEGKILLLRKKAPNFYEERLAKLVNQASSAILACNRNTREGRNKINEIHKSFLVILDELAKSQPADEVDFQTEKDRAEERDKLYKEHLRLRRKVSELEASEIDFESIGDDDPDSRYSRFIIEYEEALTELKKVSLMISKMEGERIDEEIEFELKFPASSRLADLTKEQQKDLESRILKMLRDNSHKKRTSFVDIKIMEDHINALNIEPGKFKQTEFRELVTQALDSYNLYFRDKGQEKRNIYYEHMLSNPYLRPKQGLILSNPDDLPQEVLERMDTYGKQCKEELDKVIQRYSDMEPEEYGNDAGEAIQEDGDEDNVDLTRELVDRYVSSNNRLFKRVKEEPRDDYEYDAQSDSERYIPEIMADDVENTLRSYQKQNNSDDDVILID